jgi:hypothetical protein
MVSPTIVGDTILVGLESGMLVSYGLRNGVQLGGCQWSGAFTPTAPLVVGRTFIYGAADGLLRAVPMSDLTARLGARRSCL